MNVYLKLNSIHEMQKRGSFKFEYPYNVNQLTGFNLITNLVPILSKELSWKCESNVLIYSIMLNVLN